MREEERDEGEKEEISWLPSQSKQVAFVEVEETVVADEPGVAKGVVEFSGLATARLEARSDARVLPIDLKVPKLVM